MTTTPQTAAASGAASGQFTKKSVTIDAWLIDFGNKPLPQWVHDAFRDDVIDWCPAGEGLYINTLEGHMLGSNGDWLIRGVKGELYACKPDIFEATYSPASIAAAPAQPVAPMEAQPGYSHADMTAAHTDGYKLGLAQRDAAPALAGEPGTLAMTSAEIDGISSAWVHPGQSVGLSVVRTIVLEVLSRLRARLEIQDADRAARGAAQAAPAEPWRERWHGSPPGKGWSILQGRELIAYLGPDVASETVTDIVMAHNVAKAAPVVAIDENQWEGINTLPNSDDLVWLYCQDTNTIDGPVAPRPHFADSWTHWAPAEAPSTEAIDAARAQEQQP